MITNLSDDIFSYIQQFVNINNLLNSTSILKKYYY